MAGRIMLLRNTHSGAEQAEKLRPFLSQADVVSFEVANTTAADAANIEAIIEGRGKITLSQARSRLQAADEGSADYEQALYGILHDLRKPIHLVERLDKIDSLKARVKTATSNEAHKTSVSLFYGGNYDPAVLKELESLRLLVESFSVRNRGIINPIKLRMAHAGRKAGKDQFCYAMILGAKHTIAPALSEKAGVEVEDVFFASSPYSHLKPYSEAWNLFVSGSSDNARVRSLLGRSVAASIMKEGFLGRQQGIFEYAQARNLSDITYDSLAMHILSPICWSILGGFSDDDIRAYSAALGRSGVTRQLAAQGRVEELGRPTVDFLREHGFDIPLRVEDYMKWDALFPHDQARDDAPERTLYTPKTSP